MINCDGVCTVLGVQWWIAYIIIGVVFGFIAAIAEYGTSDDGFAGLVWLVGAAFWPALLVLTLLSLIIHALGFIVKIVWDAYDLR